MDNMNLRNYAHIGDAVWELFVREYTVFKTQNSKLLHKITTDRVNSAYQAEMLNYYQILQYNSMFDKRHKSEVFFSEE